MVLCRLNHTYTIIDIPTLQWALNSTFTDSALTLTDNTESKNTS